MVLLVTHITEAIKYRLCCASTFTGFLFRARYTQTFYTQRHAIQYSMDTQHISQGSDVPQWHPAKGSGTYIIHLYRQLTLFVVHLITYVHQVLSGLKYFTWHSHTIQTKCN